MLPNHNLSKSHFDCVYFHFILLRYATNLLQILCPILQIGHSQQCFYKLVFCKQCFTNNGFSSSFIKLANNRNRTVWSIVKSELCIANLANSFPDIYRIHIVIVDDHEIEDIFNKTLADSYKNNYLLGNEIMV